MEGQAVGLRERCSVAVATHPLRTVAAVSVAVGAGHAWWIWTHRHLGAYDPDEAGYLADAFRYHRALVTGGPGALFTEIRYSGTAPLVPLLSALLLIVGPADPRMALMIQPVLLTLLCLATAGIARRVVTPRRAVVAGLVPLALPVTVLASQSYWFGLAAATFAAAAVWSLLESSAGRNRWIWAYGAAVGCMVLSRTMALAFVPGMLVGTGWVVRSDPGARRRALAAFGLAAVIAGPWYLAQREVIFSYLTSYGYGPARSCSEQPPRWAVG